MIKGSILLIGTLFFFISGYAQDEEMFDRNVYDIPVLKEDLKVGFF